MLACESDYFQVALHQLSEYENNLVVFTFFATPEAAISGVVFFYRHIKINRGR